MQVLPSLISFGVSFFMGTARASAFEVGGAPATLDRVEFPEGASSAGSGSTREALQRVKVVLEVHRSLGGAGYPATLEQLGESTPEFPKGLFDGGPVPSDEWGNPFTYVPSADGSSYRLYSLGPDGVDQGGEGDDLLAP